MSIKFLIWGTIPRDCTTNRLLGAKGKVYFGSLGFNSQDWCGNLPAGTNSPPLPTKPVLPESTNKLAVALYNQRSKTWETFCQDCEQIRNLVETSQMNNQCSAFATLWSLTLKCKLMT